MAGSNNFLPFNPPANNQESDSAYSADSQRLNGYAPDDICPSDLHNKFAYQVSIMVAALGEMLKAKGYTPNDGSASPGTALANLIGVLMNLMTVADMSAYVTNSQLLSGFAISLGPSGYIKFPTWLGGLTLQWTLGPSNPAGGETHFSVNWPTTFAHSCFQAQCSLYTENSLGQDCDAMYQIVSFNTASATVFLQEFSNGRAIATQVLLFAIGY